MAFESCVVLATHSWSIVRVAFIATPVGLTSVNVIISAWPDVKTPLSNVMLEMYIPVPLVIVGVDNGAAPDPLSIAKT